MYTVDKLGWAGCRVLARTVPPQVATRLVVWALLGFPVRLESRMPNIVESLPLMLAYPLALSTVTSALGHRGARQNRPLERLNRIDVLTGPPHPRPWDDVADGDTAQTARNSSREGAVTHR